MDSGAHTIVFKLTTAFKLITILAPAGRVAADEEVMTIYGIVGFIRLIAGTSIMGRITKCQIDLQPDLPQA